MSKMEKVHQISDVVYLINLPDGCTPGRMEAVEYFADAISELNDFITERNPIKKYHLSVTIFDIEEGNSKGVKAWLVVVS